MLDVARRALAILVALYAGVAMLGWVLDAPALTSFGVSAARTSFATAACALAMAAAILVYELPRRWRPAALVLCGLALVTVAVAFSQYTLGLPDAGYLLGRGLGRLSAATAIGFLLLSLGVLASVGRRFYASAAFAVFALILSASGIVGYIYDVAALTHALGFGAMAFPTGMIIMLLSGAVLMLEPHRGWLRYIAAGPQAWRAFQLMMPVAVIAPFVIVGLAYQGMVSGMFGAPFGFAFVTVAMAVTLGAMVVLTCARMERLDRANALLAAIVESSDDAIISKGPDGIITSWNRGAEGLFGYSAREAIGRSMEIVIPHDRAEEERDILARIGRMEHINHFETVRCTKDGGALDVSATISPIVLETGVVIGASSIIRDITARKQKDLELERSNAELEQFAYVASHDLQEPLRMVANYVELLSQRYQGQLDERADKFIHYASDGARRMQQLVSDLLAYSRVGSQGKPLVPVDVNVIVDRVAHTLGGALRASGGVVEHGDLPRAVGDELQLAQLFQNLISNAIKFRRDEAPLIRVGGERRGALICYSVSDNGIGMDVRFADRIFQMFQRLHERSAYEGSGIGLAIAKRIVERHGGSIWVEATMGEGTTMYFTLRAAK